MISQKDIETLRSIARAGHDYGKIKTSLAGTHWKIEEDDINLGYLRISIPDRSGECFRLIISYRDPDHSPYSLLTFSLFPDSEEHLVAFNLAFQRAADTLTEYLGASTMSGDHQLSFRVWPYAYRRWSLPDAEFTLVQDEFDIQEGLDVTLWAQPVGTPMEKTLRL